MSYQRRSPDYTSLVADVARRFPFEWERAREGPDGHREDAFIRRLAWELHKIDPNVGLNGKRGTDVISSDALSYLNPSGPGGVEVIDVIVGATHSPTWQDVTMPPSAAHPEGVPGKFILPVDPAGSAGISTGAPGVGSPAAATLTITADLSAVLAPLRAEIAALRVIVDTQQQELADLRARLQNPVPAPPVLSKVALKTAHGTYLTAERDGRVTNRENQPAAWQSFDLQQIRP